MGDSREPRRLHPRGRPGIPLLGTELPLDLPLSRRDVLRLGGYASAAAFLAACANGSTTGGTTVKSTGGTLTLGSNYSDPGPRKAIDDVVAAFKTANGGTNVKVNTVDHGTFQDQISSYLQGTPEDAFSWFSGHRMRFFASQGLATPVDDVWDKVKGNFSSAFAEAVKTDDGHVYGSPSTTTRGRSSTARASSPPTTTRSRPTGTTSRRSRRRCRRTG
jgi:ABC-type glycerol-3-phosphate transport system substrate-binding protein